MGNAEDYKEPFHSTIHNPTTFKYFGSLAGRYTPIHKGTIHTYILTGGNSIGRGISGDLSSQVYP